LGWGSRGEHEYPALATPGAQVARHADLPKMQLELGNAFSRQTPGCAASLHSHHPRFVMISQP
jgi:hypothetical protein